MKVIIFLLIPIFCLLAFPVVIFAACDCGSTDQANPCTGSSLSITVPATTVNGQGSLDSTFSWSFDSGGGEVRCGQFANGDFWIAPALGQSSVSLTSITGSGEISADINPEMESLGLLDGSNNYGNHSDEENIIPDLPLSISENTSVVAAIQRNEDLEGVCGTKLIVGECVDSYNILTVLDSVPQEAGANMLRPNIVGSNKDFLYLSDFDFAILPTKSYLLGTSEDELEEIRTRWSHSTEIFGLIVSDGVGYSEGGRAFRSHILIDDYGAGVAQEYYSDMALMMSGDNTFSEKKAALAAMLSYGMDIYHARFNGQALRHWGSGAGQSLGKFGPAAFFSALARDTQYSSKMSQESQYSHQSRNYGPQEIAQVHQGQGVYVWGDDPLHLGPIQYHGAYWGSVLKSQCYDGATGTCNPNIGPKTQKDPYGYIDGPPNQPGSSYVGVTYGVRRAAVALQIMMPELRQVFNYEPMIEYAKRIASSGLHTSPDPCVTPDSREDPSTCDAYRNRDCQYYGITWGAVDPSDMDSDCIKTATPPYTKVGRFLDMHGNTLDYNYGSWQIERNWDTILAEDGVVAVIIRADVNQDSSINSSDALLVLRRALNRSMSGTSWRSSTTTGDVNCDDEVNTVDALLTLREHLGLDNNGNGWCGG